MHCTDNKTGQRRALLGTLAGLAALSAGCAAPGPAPAPAPAAPAPRPAPPPPPAAAAPAAPAPRPAPPPPPPPPSAGAPDLGPRVQLAPMAAARSMPEFTRAAARRMVEASPRFSFMGKPPPMMWAIVIIETELNADGSVNRVSVTRPPANPAAAATADIAVEAIRRAGPFGDVSRLPKPVRWSEVFLFNDKNQFKPRSLE